MWLLLLLQLFFRQFAASYTCQSVHHGMDGCASLASLAIWGLLWQIVALFAPSKQQPRGCDRSCVSGHAGPEEVLWRLHLGHV